MGTDGSGSSISQLGRAATVVRLLLWVTVIVAVAFAVSTMPGVRSSAGFDVLLDGWLKNAGYVLAALVALARAILVPRLRLVWGLVAGALLARAAAFTVHAAHVRQLDPIPYPSVADAGWLLSSVLLVAALLCLGQVSRTARTFQIALDAGVAAMATASLAIALLFDTLVALAPSGTAASALIVNLAYPVLDVALLVITVGVAAAFRWHPPAAVWWLLAGVVGFAVVDSAFVYLVTAGLWRPGTPLSALSLATAVIIGAAAWVRPRQRGLQGAELADIVAPVAFALVCLGVVGYATQRQVADAAVVLALGGLAGTVVRVGISYRSVRRSARRDLALHRASVGDYTVDARTGRHRWSTAMFDILGLDESTPTPSAELLLQAVHPDDRNRVAQHQHDARATESMDVSHRIVRPDGDVRVVIHRLDAIHSVDATVVGWVGTLSDITEQQRRAAERQDLLRRSVTAADDERQRLAEQLHDDVVQLLAAAVLRLDLLNEDDAALERIHHPLAEAMRLLRTTIAELSPRDIGPETLMDAVAQHAALLLEPDGIQVFVQVELDGADDPDPLVVLTAFRIVQEALSNVRKHASARNVSANIHRRDGGLAGTIADDGIGLSAEAAAAALTEPDHLGMRLMRERASLVGGHLEVGPAVGGQGTQVSFWLPEADDQLP